MTPSLRPPRSDVNGIKTCLLWPIDTSTGRPVDRSLLEPTQWESIHKCSKAQVGVARRTRDSEAAAASSSEAASSSYT